MKKIYTTLLTLGVGSMAFAQNVNIPDATFKAALVGNASINTNQDAEIQVTEAQAFTGTINVGNMSITDLTGIEEFIAITELQCYGNQLTTLDVSQNVGLVEFYCSNNPLTSLTIGALPNLELIQCVNNSLTTLDVTQLPALDELNCKQNNLSTVDVSQNPLLTRLFCQENYNSFTSLDVTQNPDLERLFCNQNNLSALDLTQNPDLTHVNCYDNSITSLDVTQNGSLEYLACNENSISTLDLTSSVDLELLFCQGNNITSLDLTQCQSLIEVDCDNNSITAIDFSQCPNLEYFDGQSNDLQSLNAANGQNMNLGTFNASNNPNLTCIQVDDAAYSQSNWSADIDGTASFSENCCNLNTTILVNGITLTAQLNTMAYQWLDCDNGNQPIAGATNQSFTPTSNGNYACVVDNLICSSTSGCIEVTSVSLTELDAETIEIYPNPATDYLIIDVDELVEEITVIALNGKEVLQSNSSEIPLTGLNPGVYLIKIETVSGVTTKRFIKE